MHFIILTFCCYRKLLECNHIRGFFSLHPGWFKRLKNVGGYIDFIVILQCSFYLCFCRVICVFYARRAGPPSFSFPLQRAVMHFYFILFYYILTLFIAKSNAFLKFYRILSQNPMRLCFYRKNQCIPFFVFWLFSF